MKMLFCFFIAFVCSPNEVKVGEENNMNFSQNLKGPASFNYEDLQGAVCYRDGSIGGMTDSYKSESDDQYNRLFNSFKESNNSLVGSLSDYEGKTDNVSFDSQKEDDFSSKSISSVSSFNGSLSDYEEDNFSSNFMSATNLNKSSFIPKEKTDNTSIYNDFYNMLSANSSFDETTSKHINVFNVIDLTSSNNVEPKHDNNKDPLFYSLSSPSSNFSYEKTSKQKTDNSLSNIRAIHQRNLKISIESKNSK